MSFSPTKIPRDSGMDDIDNVRLSRATPEQRPKSVRTDHQKPSQLDKWHVNEGALMTADSNDDPAPTLKPRDLILEAEQPTYQL